MSDITLRDRLDQIFGSPHWGTPRPTIPETIEDQDRVFALYDQYGIVNGAPGSLTDVEVTEKLREIMTSILPSDQKIFLLQTLDVAICNNHIAGMAAQGVAQVSESIREVMYESGIMVRED